MERPLGHRDDTGRDGGDANKQIFAALQEKRPEIERDFGEPLEWEERPRACRIKKRIPLPALQDEVQWPEAHAAMVEAMGELPDHLRRSITWDRGSEMANWQNIQLLNTPVFFCNPHSPWQLWQRGTNENTNRLLRFWFEKGTDLSGYTRPTSNASKTNSTPDPDPPSISTHPPSASPP